MKTKLQEKFEQLSKDLPLMDGLTMKKIKTFRGHDGTNIQGSLYLNNKEVAFIGEDAWGGPLDYEFTDEDAMNKIQDFVDNGKFVVHLGKDASLDVDFSLYLANILTTFDLLSYDRKRTKTHIFNTLDRTIAYYNAPFTKEFEQEILPTLEENDIIINYTYR